MKIMHEAIKGLIFALCFSLTTSLAAGEKTTPDDVDVIDWELMQKRMAMLSPLGYHPFLMPLLMKHRDVLGLAPYQIKIFMDWRSKYRTAIIHTMNQIVNKRNEFNKISLRPDTTDEVLIAKQAEIFKLHKKVLTLQLSCRRNILDTFTEEQWDNFRFALMEEGYEID